MKKQIYSFFCVLLAILALLTSAFAATPELLGVSDLSAKAYFQESIIDGLTVKRELNKSDYI